MIEEGEISRKSLEDMVARDGIEPPTASLFSADH